MNPSSDLLETAIDAARAAARSVRDSYHKPMTVRIKGFRDIVTEVDFTAQDVAVEAIRSRFPGAAILGEENLSPEFDAERMWIIDPIDGTTNYARGFPIFGISIGVTERGRSLAGVVYDPLHDYLFTAERGRGAMLNGSPIHVSDVRAVSEAIVALDWCPSPEDRLRTLALLNRLAVECRTVRAVGSAALAMCYLAAGWIDLFFNLALKPWDGAAAQVIVEEAGGRITAPDGRAWNYDAPSALASNGHLHFIYDTHRIDDSAY